ncbi:hypothetical protein BH09BAC5_BH09BAC5_28190 [soil metagenome]
MKKYLFPFLFALLSFSLLKATNYSGVFNGTNASVNLGTTAGSTGIRSIEFWFCPAVNMSPSTSATGWTFFNRNDGSQQAEFGCYIRGTDWNSVGYLGYLHFFMRNNGTLHEVRSDQNTWTAGMWYHVAGVFDPSTGLKLYINGTLQAQTDPGGTVAVLTDNTHNTTLGTWAGVRNFQGQMDELRFWNRAITPSEISAKMCQDLVPANENGLAGYWKFDEGTGVSLLDETINNFTGSVSGMTWSTIVPCNSTPGNYVMHFDGSGDYIDAGLNSGNYGLRSIEFWFKPNVTMDPNTSSAGWTFFNRNDGNQQNEYGCYIRGTDWNSVGYLGYLHFFMRNNGTLHEVRSDQNSWTVGTWYHVAGVFDSATGLKLYINGVLQTQTDPTGTVAVGVDNIHPTTLGAWGGTRFLNAEMDELRFWNRSISQSEIQTKMCSNLVPANENGLVGYWKFNEGSGLYVIDSSASMNNGTVYNATWVIDNYCLEIGVHEISNSTEEVTVYPNPSDGNFYVSTGFSNVQIEIYNMMGELIYAETTTNSETNVRLPNVAKGLYLLRITDKDGVVRYEQKILKN